MELDAIGYFTKTHGVKGHLILRNEKDFELEGLQAVFLDSPTGKAPYFIQELKDAAQGLILKLEEVDAVEVAKKFIGKTVYIETRFIIENEAESNYLDYQIIEKRLGPLGKVLGTSDNGQQELLSVKYLNKEIILPLAEEFIEKIDDDAKIIWYTAPEGLIEIYLEGGG